MNELDPRLQRLFRAAARAVAAPVPDTPPFGFETRVLAHWAACKDTAAQVFRRAFLICSGVMALAIALSYSSWTASATTEVTLADSAIETSLP